MCEILLRVQDKPTASGILNPLHTSRGDVVVVMPDGHIWGTAELSSPDWIILKMPGLPESALADMTRTRQHSKDPAKTIGARYAKFDLDDPWLSETVGVKRIVSMSSDDVTRLLGTKRIRPDESVEVVG